MAVEVKMPQLSDTMEEGTLIKWHVEEGEHVEMNDVLAEVETDKATMDLEAFDEGTVLKKLVDEGDVVPTQSLVAVIGKEGEDISHLLGGDEAGSEESETEEASEAEPQEDAEPDPEPSGEPDPVALETTEPESAEEPDEDESGEETDTEEEETESGTAEPTSTEGSPPSESTDGQGVLRASPVARRMASRHGLDLRQVEGSGPEGRVVKRDVEQALEEGVDRGRVQEAPQAQGSGAPRVDSQLSDEEVPLTGMRKTIASRMTDAKRDVPHFYLERDLNAEPLADIRSQLNDERSDEEKFSLNDFILAAVARALTQHPRMNASFQGDHIQHHDQVDLGFAVAVEDGLFTPVVEGAESKSLDQIRVESRELIQRALDGDLTPEEYQGATFTVSNLGMFDIENFSAVINPPEAGILAVGALREEPVVEDGDLTVGKRMAMTLSGDHRVIDGAIGARFLQTLARYIQQPVRLLA